MANYYWRGATSTDWQTASNWRTATGGGGSVYATIPTLSDDVFFDSTALANCFLNANSNCNNINFTGFNRTFQHTAHNLNVYGSMTVASGMTYNIVNALSSTLTFKATSTGKTLTSGGKTLPSMTFDGAGGGWTLQDALTITSNYLLNLNQGTLDTNGKTVTAGYFFVNGSSARTLTLGASTLNLAGTSFAGTGGWSVGSDANFTLNSNTSTINLTGFATSDVSTYWGGKTYNVVSITNQQGIHNLICVNASFASLTLGNRASVDCEFTLDSDIVATTLQVSGLSAAARQLVRSDTLGTARKIKNTTLSAMSYVDFQDIDASLNASGAARAAWSGTSIGNCLGNTNITFTSSVFRYAVATGNWSDTACWSATNGGASGATSPLPQDTAVFSSSSGANTITANQPRLCSFLDMTSAYGNGVSTATLYLNGNTVYYDKFYIFGSCYLYPDTTTSLNCLGLYLRGRTGSPALRFSGSASVFINFPLIIDGGGTYSLTNRTHLSTSTLTLSKGTLTHGVSSSLQVTLSALILTGTDTRTIDFDLNNNGVNWNLTGTGTVLDITNGTNLTLNSGLSVLNITDASSTTKTLYCGSKTFYQILLSGSGTGMYYFIGGFYCTEFKSTKTNAYTIQFQHGYTLPWYYFRRFTVRGSSGNIVTIQSDAGGFHFQCVFKLLTGTGYRGYAESDYLKLIDTAGLGPSDQTSEYWYAGANSIDDTSTGGTNSYWMWTDWQLSTKFDSVRARDDTSPFNKRTLSTVIRTKFDSVKTRDDTSPFNKRTISPVIRTKFHGITTRDDTSPFNKRVVTPIYLKNIYESYKVRDSNISKLNPLSVRYASDTIKALDIANAVFFKKLIPINLFDDIKSLDFSNKFVSPIKILEIYDTISAKDFKNNVFKTPLIPRNLYETVKILDSSRQPISPIKILDVYDTAYALDAKNKLYKTPLIPRNLYEPVVSTDVRYKQTISPRIRSYEPISVSQYNRSIITPIKILGVFDRLSVIDIKSKLYKSPLIPRSLYHAIKSSGVRYKQTISPRIRSAVEIVRIIDYSKLNETLLVRAAMNITCLDIITSLSRTLMISKYDPVMSSESLRVFESLYTKVSEPIRVSDALKNLKATILAHTSESVSAEDWASVNGKAIYILLNLFESIYSLEHSRVFSTIITSQSEQLGIAEFQKNLQSLLLSKKDSIGVSESIRKALGLYTKQSEILKLVDSIAINFNLWKILSEERVRSTDDLRKICETIIGSYREDLKVREYKNIRENPLFARATEYLNLSDYARILETILLYTNELVDTEDSQSIYKYIGYKISKWMGLYYENYTLNFSYASSIKSASYLDRILEQRYRNKERQHAYFDSWTQYRYT